MGIGKAAEYPSLTGESVGEAHMVLEGIQTNPPGNQYLKGHNPLMGSEENDGKWGES